MKIVVDKNKYFFIQLAIICLLVGIVCTFILPSKFYNDAEIIVNDYYNQIGLIGGYPFTILFYSVTGLNKLPYFIVAIIQIPILFYLLYKIGIPNNFRVLNLQNILVYISLFLVGLFICIPSKEFINFIYLTLIVLLFKNKNLSLKKTLLLSFLMFFLISFVFRPYYLFLPILSVMLYGVTYIKSKLKVLNIVFFSIIFAVMMSISHGIIRGEYISESTREMHNFDRLGSDEAQSMIQSPISTETWYGESFGIFYGYLSVNIPVIELKHFLKPQIIAFIIWQLLFFYVLYEKFKICLKSRENFKYEIWIFLFIFSYFVVQGLFEPDLGSAIRHKIGIFPLLYYVLYYEKFIIKS